jgi:hypothetical protein
MANLDSLVGKFGVTTDKVFGVITDTLEKLGQVIDDREYATPNAWAELVLTKYKVVENGYPKFYELWYQVKTPFSPDNMECSFGFDETDK